MHDADGPLTPEESAGTTVARHYEAVDARTVVRTLESRLAALGYRVVTTNWSLESDDDADHPAGGDGATLIYAHIAAVTDDPEETAATGTITYRPHGTQGGLLALVGAIFSLPTVFISLALTAVGLLLYRRTDAASVPLVRRTGIDVTVTGRLTEGSSATLERGEPTAADLEVRAVGGPSFAVDPARLDDLPWPLHTTLARRVDDWHGEFVDDSPPDRDFGDEFFEHLIAWRNRDSEISRERITAAQADLERSQETRTAYTAALGVDASAATDAEESGMAIEDTLEELLEGLDDSDGEATA
ncbi:hypothetical protein [Natronobiforma cellulositropha]|uniref:hypothetical protein n=1 Tax=Natronobiforma cellulositropha TaxID=1679076 RepID=UPI0021D575A0|nr:hypothetical protein [Natronobiforma cellulositropha]